MREEGVVKSTSGEFCEVVVRRKSACGDNCASCSGGCRMKFQTVTAKNQIGAEAGDSVAIEIESKKVLFSAFLVYMLGIIVFITVFYAVQKVYDSGIVALISALMLTLITLFLTVLYDRRHKDDFIPIVIKIEEKG